MSTDGIILDLYDFDQDSKPLLAAAMTIDADGSALVVGNKLENNFLRREVFIHRINLQTGNILEDKLLADDSTSQIVSHILSTGNGYVLNISRESFELTPFISFYDHNFNLTNSVSYAKTPHISFFSDFIAMQDGGFCSVSFNGTGLMAIQ